MLRVFQHILGDECRDPDCEVHRPDVGLAEGTVTPDQYAFFLAGLSYLPAGDLTREAEFAAAREFLARYSPS